MTYKGFIYKHKNKFNNKVYIGQTIQNPETRWGKDGKNYYGQRLFYRDIVEYGWDNFEHIILEEVEASTEKELKQKLNNLETKYIIDYESIRGHKGYNKFLCSDNVSTMLTAKAKRWLEYYMKENKLTLKESIKAYLEKKDIEKHNNYKKQRKKRD